MSTFDNSDLSKMLEYNLPMGKLCIYKITFNYSILSIGAYHRRPDLILNYFSLIFMLCVIRNMS